MNGALHAYLETKGVEGCLATTRGRLVVSHRNGSGVEQVEVDPYVCPPTFPVVLKKNWVEGCLATTLG